MNDHVLVIGDWDADGVVSAAIIYYLQEKLGLYPIKQRMEVILVPSGPRGLREKLRRVEGSPKALVILDIPYIRGLDETLKVFKEQHGSHITYIDHHLSTIYVARKLEGVVDDLIVGHSPTVILAYNLARSLGARLTPRLEAFVKAVALMEKGSKIPENLKGMIRLAASISKALTVTRDPDYWRQLVKWLASPLIIPQPLIKKEVIEKALELSDETDRKVKELAMELALSARTVGYIKFVDARKRWKGRGSTALASKLYHILKQPVAVLVTGREDYPLLIVKAKRGGANRIARVFYERGIVVDIGGHESLAIIRLKKGLPLESILKVLREASLKL